MVAFDQAMWKCMLGSYTQDAICQDMYDDGLLPANAQGDAQQPGLPGGDGAITLNGSVIEVTVQWQDNDGVMQSVVIDSQG
jgi:hypothetical protein